MKRWLYAASASLFAVLCWQSPTSAQTTAAATASHGPAGQPQANIPVAQDLITFDEYRAYRLQLIARRRASLKDRLAESGLSPMEKARIERLKGYYDYYAAMPAAERDRRFRARFDEIDTDHDGTISGTERAAWRDKERQRYRQLAAQRADNEK